MKTSTTARNTRSRPTARASTFPWALTPGKYKVTAYRTPDDQKANKELYHVNGFQVQLDENTLTST